MPVKNPEVKEASASAGHIFRTYPVYIRSIWRKWFPRSKPEKQKTVYHRKLQLDALGTAVWQQMDGRRSVSGIIEWFADTYQLHPLEAEKAVTLFLRDLGKRGLIGLK